MLDIPLCKLVTLGGFREVMGDRCTELLPTVLEYVGQLEIRNPDFVKFTEDLAAM